MKIKLLILTLVLIFIFEMLICYRCNCDKYPPRNIIASKRLDYHNKCNCLEDFTHSHPIEKEFDNSPKNSTNIEEIFSPSPSEEMTADCFDF